MNQMLQLAGINLLIETDRPLVLFERTQKFAVTAGKPDVIMTYCSDGSPYVPAGEPLGQNRVIREYRENGWRYHVGMELHGPVLSIRYDDQYTFLEATGNESVYPGGLAAIDYLLQMMPMKGILLHWQAAILHSSSVVVHGRALVFAGASGVGKTTQRRLWQSCAGARALTNDRTLIRKHAGVWQASSYLVDGGDPVEEVGSCPIGAVVLLRQGTENQVQRLRVGRAVAGLINQTMLNPWDPQMTAEASLLLMELYRDLPVYELTCRPEEGAVRCLQTILQKEGASWAASTTN